MYDWRENTLPLVFIVLLDAMLKRGVGGFWFFVSNFKKDTWCYAISWCAMFVLYTGSGEMLLLRTDSGMIFLPFEPCHDAVTSWWHWWCHTIVTRVLMGVTVTTTMNDVGRSYAENFLVNLNNKDKLQFSALVLFFLFVGVFVQHIGATTDIALLVFGPYWSAVHVQYTVEPCLKTTRGRQTHTVQASSSALLQTHRFSQYENPYSKWSKVLVHICVVCDGSHMRMKENAFCFF